VDLRDPRDFEQAVREHGERVYASALRVLRDPGRAEDVRQDVFVRLWRNPSAFDASRGELGSYLQLMARSRALDLWRADRALGRAQERLALLSDREKAEPPPSELAERRADRGALVRALRRLPASQREAVVLSFFGGLSASEIARRTGAPLGTVKSRVTSAIAKLALDRVELIGEA
jgi:RNA polymerase sigma-70 factor, ECF subfamily